MMRDDRDQMMYDVNNLLDKIRTEFYELLDFDPEVLGDQAKIRRRREVLQLLTELRIMAEQV